MKIAFSLLHYNNMQVTEAAVSYLQKLDGIDACEILIVDNCSPNGSGIELKKKYAEFPNIHVILNDKNGGFAYGNNIGYSFAKENLRCDIIAVMNNLLNLIGVPPFLREAFKGLIVIVAVLLQKKDKTA